LTVDSAMKKTPQSKPVLANWGRRFIAWLIDYIIINVMLAYFGLESLETQLLPGQLLPRLPGFDISVWSPLSILIFFLYWTFTEWYFGRSIGQLLLNVRAANLQGKGISLRESAIQSLGKSLLLPIDCLVGWVWRPCRERRQRLFNRLSNTIVIFIGGPELVVQKGEYAEEP
jgi:uncharacterized RDD family membrane protein YckC